MMQSEKILVSACLLGRNVRYDGGNHLLQHPLMQRWQAEQRLVVVCPEVDGGLQIPRPPAERQANGRIITVNQLDVTPAFRQGAQMTLRTAQLNNIRFALMKAKSPSCGNEQIYDGNFNRRLIPGQGMTAALLSQHGIKVFNENQLDQLAEQIQSG